ncbi:MAG: VOC family protein [Thomasclavelia sp.]|jgi:catechol 2,3-dioxygenase-like lactoylglutathione lyase family enzyme|nr:VOC family protein [Thomasclavelia sp.]
MNIHHINIKIKQNKIDETINLYTKYFGFEVEARFTGANGNPAVMLSNNQIKIEIFSDEIEEIKGTYQHIALKVDNLNELVNTLKKDNYNIFIEPKKVNPYNDVNLMIAFVKGPSNEDIELVQEI